MRDRTSKGWCILRTAPGQTLQLAEALTDAGIEAWTPVETIKPAPRKVDPWDKRPAPPRRKPALVTRPLLASYVFARADHLPDLVRMAHSPALTYRVWDPKQRRMVSKGHPSFRLFEAGLQTVPDEQLAALRMIERRRKPRGKLPTFKAGDRVRLTEGAYEGLRGVVVWASGKLARVTFPGGLFDFDIHTWLLIPDEVKP